MYVVEGHVCDGAFEMKILSDCTRRKLEPKSGCRSGRHSTRSVGNEISVHGSLIFAMGKGGEVRST